MAKTSALRLVAPEPRVVTVRDGIVVWGADLAAVTQSLEAGGWRRDGDLYVPPCWTEPRDLLELSAPEILRLEAPPLPGMEIGEEFDLDQGETLTWDEATGCWRASW